MSAATKRVRLSFDKLYQLKWMIGGLLSLVSLWTIAYLDLNSGILLAVAAFCITATLLFPALPGKIPAFAWNMVTPLLILAIITDFILSRPDIIPPLVRMVLMLVMVRSLQYRRRREDMQLILLCLFIVVISGVLTLSLTFALQILLFTPCAMGLLFVINLTESCDRGSEIPAGLWDEFRLGHFLKRTLLVMDMRLLGIAVLLFAGVVVVSSLIFLVIPRFRLDQAIPFFNLKGKARSGFTDSIDFGDVAEIIEDDSVALRVDLPDEGVAKVPVNPYWRMVVLDEYFNRSFRMSFSAKRKNRIYSDQQFFMKGPLGSKWEEDSPNKWTFYLEGGISKFLPVVGPFYSIRFQTRKDVEFNEILNLAGTTNISSSVLFYQIGQMAPTDSVPAHTTMRGEKPLAEMETVFLDPDKSSQPKKITYPQTTLAVPGGLANLKILESTVAAITGSDKLDAREFSARAVDYLRSRHGYTLNMSIPPGKADELVRWLGSAEPGHCELFAGSFTLLARLAGIPTRLVTGFRGGSWSGFENYYMVRNRDAHAWCEVYDGQGNWFRVDPTPGGGRPGDTQSSSLQDRLIVDTSWVAYFDSLRILWYRRIVNFDKDQQDEMATKFKTAGTETMKTLKLLLRDRLDALKYWFAQPWSGSHWVRAGLIVLITLVVYLLIRNLGWWLPIIYREAKFFGIDLKSDPIRKKAGKLVARFRAHNLAQSVSQAKEIHPRDWERVYKHLLDLRFGDSRFRPPHRAVFKQARNLLKLLPSH